MTASGTEEIAWWTMGHTIPIWVGRVASLLACAAAVAAMALLPFGRLPVPGDLMVLLIALGVPRAW